MAAGQSAHYGTAGAAGGGHVPLQRHPQLLNCLKTLPVDLRDVEQSVLARHDLYEAAVRQLGYTRATMA